MLQYFFNSKNAYFLKNIFLKEFYNFRIQFKANQRQNHLAKQRGVEWVLGLTCWWAFLLKELESHLSQMIMDSGRRSRACDQISLKCKNKWVFSWGNTALQITRTVQFLCIVLLPDCFPSTGGARSRGLACSMMPRFPGLPATLLNCSDSWLMSQLWSDNSASHLHPSSLHHFLGASGPWQIVTSPSGDLLFF